MQHKPRIIHTKELIRTKIFCIEELSLEFSNGEKRIYERMISGRRGAVMIIALTAQQELILVKEYCAGTDDYQLAFPKGLMEQGETPIQAANRELKEETGYGGKSWQQLKTISLAPGYFNHQMYLLFAEELYAEKLVGDEPEPLQVVLWPFTKIEQLLSREDFTEARSIAALFILEKYLNSRS